MQPTILVRGLDSLYEATELLKAVKITHGDYASFKIVRQADGWAITGVPPEVA